VSAPRQIITAAITNLFASQKNKVLLLNANERAVKDILEAVKNGMQSEVDKTFMLNDFYQHTDRKKAATLVK